MEGIPFWVSLISGAVAGTAVDVSLFPLDTIKTRLQSKQGFIKSGGFSGIYSGIGPAALGSAPNAAVFFCAYDFVKVNIEAKVDPAMHPIVHMFSASIGEITACLIRVPVEVIKQRRQTMVGVSSRAIVRQALLSEGIFGLYRGYTTTVMREIPFSLIQFPLWEAFQSFCSQHKQKTLTPVEVAICGSVAGGIAAAVTTPLDVAKTRIMLAAKNTEYHNSNALAVLRSIHSVEGWRGLFAGVLPRSIWMSLGGFIFLGTYSQVKSMLRH